MEMIQQELVSSTKYNRCHVLFGMELAFLFHLFSHKRKEKKKKKTKEQKKKTIKQLPPLHVSILYLIVAWPLPIAYHSFLLVLSHFKQQILCFSSSPRVAWSLLSGPILDDLRIKPLSNLYCIKSTVQDRICTIVQHNNASKEDKGKDQLTPQREDQHFRN